MYQTKARLHDRLGFEVWVVNPSGRRVFTCFATLLQTAFDEAQTAIARLSA